MSQCDQLAALLADGRWWSTRELLRDVPCIVHSRVAELRKRGLEIEHETTGAGAAGSRYRLLSEREITRESPKAGDGRGEASAADGQPSSRSESSPSFSAEPMAERDQPLVPASESPVSQAAAATAEPASALTTPVAAANPSRLLPAATGAQLTFEDAA